MLRKKKGRVEWLEFEMLQEFPELAHGVFLRPERTRNINREKVQKIIGCKTIVVAEQCHGAFVQEIPLAQKECDGMITDQEETGILIKHADCQAAIFYDPIQKVIAGVHAGWRGNVQKIYTETVAKFSRRFGSKPANLFVCISPSLGPCCAEFIHYEKELPRTFLPFQIKPTYFNLWDIAKDELLGCGILPHHIQVASICTVCTSKDFFSWRRDKIKGCGNETIVSLRSKDRP